MYGLARVMQFAGLVILPLSILLELQDRVSLRQCLTISAFGGTLFAFGYLIQGLTAKNGK